MFSTSAMAEVSYNVGFASEYYFRGILQESSSASAGADYTNGGFYLGTWTADVGDGLEVDLYGGYGMEFDGFTASIGVTGYYYTGQFDDKYEEINLGLGFGAFTADLAIGKAGFSSNESDYTHMQIGYAADNGVYANFGMYGQDADGEWAEIGYGTTIADLDVTISYIFSSEEISDERVLIDNPALDPEDDASFEATNSEALIFTIGKSF